jgi:hypothetical protein
MALSGLGDGKVRLGKILYRTLDLFTVGLAGPSMQLHHSGDAYSYYRMALSPSNQIYNASQFPH